LCWRLLHLVSIDSQLLLLLLLLFFDTSGISYLLFFFPPIGSAREVEMNYGCLVSIQGLLNRCAALVHVCISCLFLRKKSVEMIHFCVAFHIDEKVMVNKTIDGRGWVYY
jgi:hypothetical protein